jgi:hypothetical protein
MLAAMPCFSEFTRSCRVRELCRQVDAFMLKEQLMGFCVSPSGLDHPLADRPVSGFSRQRGPPTRRQTSFLGFHLAFPGMWTIHSQIYQFLGVLPSNVDHPLADRPVLGGFCPAMWTIHSQIASPYCDGLQRVFVVTANAQMVEAFLFKEQLFRLPSSGRSGVPSFSVVDHPGQHS